MRRWGLLLILCQITQCAVHIVPCGTTASSDADNKFILIYDLKTSSAGVWTARNEHAQLLYSWYEYRNQSATRSSDLELTIFCQLGIQKLHTSICDATVCYYKSLIHQPVPGVHFGDDTNREFRLPDSFVTSRSFVDQEKDTLSYLARPLYRSSKTSMLVSASYAKKSHFPDLYDVQSPVALLTDAVQMFGGDADNAVTNHYAQQKVDGHVGVLQLLQFVDPSNSKYAYLVRSGQVSLIKAYAGQPERWVVQLGRICLDDKTPRIFSYIELTLDCGDTIEYNYIATLALVNEDYSRLLLYCEPVKHHPNDVIAKQHRVVEHDLTTLYPLFDDTWATCQKIKVDGGHDSIVAMSDSSQPCQKFGPAGTSYADSCSLPTNVLNMITHLVNTGIKQGRVLAALSLNSHSEDDVFEDNRGHAAQMMRVADDMLHVIYDYGYWARIKLNENTSASGLLIERALPDGYRVEQGVLLVEEGMVAYNASDNSLSKSFMSECHQLYPTESDLIVSRGMDGCVWCVPIEKSVSLRQCLDVNGAYVTNTRVPVIDNIVPKPGAVTDNSVEASVPVSEIQIYGKHFGSFNPSISVEVCKQPCRPVKLTNDIAMTCKPDSVAMSDVSNCYVNVSGLVENRAFAIRHQFSSPSTQGGGTPTNSNTVTLAVILSVAALVVLAVVVFVFVCRRKQNRKKRNDGTDSQTVLPIALEERQSYGRSWFLKFFDNRYEMRPPPAANGSVDGRPAYYEDLCYLVPTHIFIPFERILFIKQVGEGNFGIVFEATLLPAEGASNQSEQKVAVKTLRAFAGGYREFLQEGLRMEHFNHDRVMSLIGISFTEHNQPMIITSFMERGNLYNYLVNTSNAPTLLVLLNFCVEIAEGMQYLHKLRFIHRDLATRNCMFCLRLKDSLVLSNYITSHYDSRLDEQNHIRISDFGMCRDVYETNDIYESTRGGNLPLRWVAPESIGSQEFTYKGDVWAYGVTVWECMTRGAYPYEGIEPQYLADFLATGRRLNRPMYCPEIVYNDIMMSCWHADPNQRPTFEDLCLDMPRVIQSLLDQNKQTAQPQQNLHKIYERVDHMRHSLL